MEGLSWEEVGERVREARLAIALSQEDLGRSAGLDRTAVVKIEGGKRQVSALEMARLAQALGLPLTYFVSRPLPVMSHRAELADDSMSEAGRQSFQLDTALEAWVRDIRQLMELGLLTLPEHLLYPRPVATEEEAREAARWARGRLELGTDPIDLLMLVAQRAGQLIVVEETRGDGASVVDGPVAAAIVNRWEDPGRRRATAAHELGHLVLGDEYSSDAGVHAPRDAREAVVNVFAGEFLLPGKVVASVARAGWIAREPLVKLAAEYRVSWSLALRQARSVARVVPELRNVTPTKAELRSAIGWAPQPDLDSTRVPPLFAQAVMDAWKASYLTSARAVELMRGQLAAEDLPAREGPDPEP